MNKKILATKYGDYENYKGRVWIGKQNTEEIQGTNIAIKVEGSKDDELHVISYVIRKNDRWCFTGDAKYTLDEIVRLALNGIGWYDQVCEEVLAE